MFTVREARALGWTYQRSEKERGTLSPGGADLRGVFVMPLRNTKPRTPSAY